MAECVEEVRRKLLIVGHSHVNVFGFPSQIKDGAYNFVDVPHESQQIFGFATKVGPYERAHWDLLLENASDFDILILWIGSQHLAEFLFQENAPFDFVMASNPRLPLQPGVRIVPEAVIRNYQMRFLSQLDDLLARLAIRPAGRVFVGETPPPKGDDLALRSLMIREAHFLNRARMLGMNIADVVFTPRSLRLKLWCVIQE